MPTLVLLYARLYSHGEVESSGTTTHRVEPYLVDYLLSSLVDPGIEEAEAKS
jgi:hypothetical protein